MVRKVFGAALALGMLFGFSLAQAQTPDIGQTAPPFSLSTPDGKQLSLSNFTRKGPVVLVVLRGYPGYQCPYCVRQVHDFVENASKFAADGAQVLLVYPGPPAELDSMRRRIRRHS